MLANTSPRPGIEGLFGVETVRWTVQCPKVEAMVRCISAWVTCDDDVIACLEGARPNAPLAQHSTGSPFDIKRNRQASAIHHSVVCNSEVRVWGAQEELLDRSLDPDKRSILQVCRTDCVMRGDGLG
jgi:hypothetical protein